MPKKGGGFELHRFDAFGPKVLTGIDNGRIPAPTRSRCHVVPMAAQRPGDERKPTFLGFKVREETRALRERASQWVERNADALRDPEPEFPVGFDGRRCEKWWWMLGRADAAGGDWRTRGHAAAERLEGADHGRAPVSLERRLLADVHSIFDGRSFVRTEDLLFGSNMMDGAPWGGFSDGKGISAQKLGRMLSAYPVRPGGEPIRSAHSPDGSSRGYRAADLEDAWTRYGACLRDRQEPSGSVRPESLDDLPEDPGDEFAPVPDAPPAEWFEEPGRDR